MVTYPGPATVSYEFDAFGNRTEMTDSAGATAYTYDDADRLTAVDPPGASATTYTWDDNGNLTARGSDSFAWDIEDRMTSATVNSTTTTFAYRGDGLRNSRTTGGVTTTFTWDIAAGLPVILDDGTGKYVYGSGLTSMITGSGTYYYLADGLGSTMAIVNSSGVSQNSYTYDVYGKPTVTGSLANEFDFAGQQTDATGLQYLRTRYYDPAVGRFIDRDAAAVLQGWLLNPFSYADSSPTGRIDPGGMAAIDSLGPSASSGPDAYCPEPPGSDNDQPGGGISGLCPPAPAGGGIGGGGVRGPVGGGPAGGSGGRGPKPPPVTPPPVKAQVSLDRLIGEYKGFRSSATRDGHISDHAGRFSSAGDYLSSLQSFFADTSRHWAITRANGSTMYYNFARNEFGVVSKDGFVQTFYKPDDGAAYFIRMLTGY